MTIVHVLPLTYSNKKGREKRDYEREKEGREYKKKEIAF